MNHSDKQAKPVALVTGSARRIGAAMVRCLVAHNYRVVIHCRNNKEAADNLAQELGNNALVLVQDLLVENAAALLLEKTIAWAGRLDVLINNASVFIKDDLRGFDASIWEELMGIHARLPYELSQLAYPYLAANQGQIINITDIHAEQPLKDYGMYCQSKAALAMQTKVLASAFAPKVRVNAIAPGAIMWPEEDNTLSKALQDKIIARTPLKRHGDPEFIAQAMWALVSNPFITGQTLKVDGGRSIGG